MKNPSGKTFPVALFLIMALLFAGVSQAASDSDEKIEHDYSKLAVFVQPAISFISFEEREYFQDAIDTIYHDFRSVALTNAESLSVAKQDFQKVNFCFPLTAGIQYQPIEDHFISAGIGFIYDNESVVLTDRKGKTHNYSYTLQGVPLFLEYRLAFPKNLITLGSGSLFSIAVRWYWTLPGTEIYTTWGILEAKNSILGAGFGVSLGYLFASWKSFNLYGDIGFTSISVKSKDKFSKIVPGGPDEKAKWNLGGLQFQIRVSFGVWNNPRKKAKNEDDDDDDIDDENATASNDSTAKNKTKTDSLAKPLTTDGSATIAKDSSETASIDSTSTADSSATKTDSSAASANATDSTKAVADSSVKAATPANASNDTAAVKAEAPKANIKAETPTDTTSEKPTSSSTAATATKATDTASSKQAAPSNQNAKTTTKAE